mmetsp:Transcript_13803/g.23023  ORF Transcript_13803/g.23023 Transcript_13803/m.23023 type:complete len:772 (+) Transcript_13803:20-2335(+)
MSVHSRQDLSSARRVVIKAGTSTVSTPDGYPSLSRIANIVENAARLRQEGKEVIIVTSGAVGVGKQKLSRQGIMTRSVSDLLGRKEGANAPSQKGLVAYNSACAAAGQLGLMALYDTMFGQYNITVSQLLVTSSDFTSPERCRNIQYVISQLLSLGVVPLLNENDAVSANQGYETYGTTFSDNDSLASLVAVEVQASLLVLLTDVSGVYDRPPSDPQSKVIDIFRESTGFQVGQKSTQGRGGMGAKVAAALKAIKGGVPAVVVASGEEGGIVARILEGEQVGTMFLPELADATSGEDQQIGLDVSGDSPSDGRNPVSSKEKSIEETAESVRAGGRTLQSLPAASRTKILLQIAASLDSSHEQILAANAQDLEAAERNQLSLQMLNRLKLTKDKLDTLSKGIRAIASSEDPIGQVLAKTELAESLVLDKVSCPIGVLLIIFESRPECLPQIAALAVRSGNGLLLKGGKEAEKSNACLHSIITEAISSASQGQVAGAEVVHLVTSRNDIKSLLKLDKCIDLVIPRGGNALVSFIKANTRIPVMGHADGICHVYVDKHADLGKAERIVVDSKTDYPSACNAAECLLIHEDLVTSANGSADRLLRALRAHGVTLFGAPRAQAMGLTEQAAADLHTEYGDLQMTVQVVSSLAEAVTHIHTYGSGHTESIVTEDAATAEAFVRSVDSACVFHNASTRFADGFRFGLGAEVGISTGRIHARGPVGVEGLVTSKWLLRSSHVDGHTAADFSSKTSGRKRANGEAVEAAPLIYTHKKMKI